MSVAKSLCSEALGTMILLATIIGSGIMAESLSGGNVAIALLGNTLPTGAMLMVLITLFGPVSGAHFNPVVTAAFWMRGEITLPLAIGFICVQSVGGIAGSWLAHLMFEQPILQFSDTSRSGLAQYFSEFIATSGLLLVIFGGLANRPAAVPMLVGLYITAAYWFTASTSFANPAVTIARTFSDSFAGIAAGDVPYFILAQILAVYPIVKICSWLFGASSEKDT